MGRDDETGRLRRAVDRAGAGRGTVVLIEGEPGIGKSRLVEVACDEARAAGFEVATGAQAMRCRALVDQDADLLVQALRSYRACPRPAELAAACEDAAALLAATGRLAEAARLWEEAIGVYERVGAERAIARIAAQQRRHGMRRGARQRHVRATSGWDSLTETERKVVALVAQRLTNPEVAERLFISRHTVESHLKHVYRKLGVSSRVELARSAAAALEGPGRTSAS